MRSLHVLQRLAEAIATLSGIGRDRRTAEALAAGAATPCRVLKQFDIPVSGTLGFNKAEVTAGGVALNEVDSHTMDSRLAAVFTLRAKSSTSTDRSAVTIFRPPSARAGWPERMLDMNVLYEDNHLLVLNKPAGLPTMGTPGGQPTLLSLAKDYVKQKYGKPGNVYLGVVSRLDSPVTGIVLFADFQGGRAADQQFRTCAVQKTYWCVLNSPIADSGSFTDWLVHDDRHRRVHIVASGRPDAKEARLTYRQIASDGHLSLLEIDLETGRKHQIRVQLAHHGQAVAGDRKYGSLLKFPAGIALHSRRLVVAHPVRDEAMDFALPLPKYWPRAFQ